MDNSVIDELLVWINAEVDAGTPLVIPDVARRAGYSQHHLQREFTRVTGGEKLASYIRKRRLVNAAVALRSTAQPIIAIALGVGYADQQPFTRAFGREFGISPDKYRRKHRGTDGQD